MVHTRFVFLQGMARASGACVRAPAFPCWFFLLLLACSSGNGSGRGEDASKSDCRSLSDTVQRENCRFERISQLYSTNRQAFRNAMKELEPAASRDLVRLRLAIEDPAGASMLCRDVETSAAAEKCRQVLGRPHLRSPNKLPRDPSSVGTPTAATSAGAPEPGAGETEGDSR